MNRNSTWPWARTGSLALGAAMLLASCSEGPTNTQQAREVATPEAAGAVSAIGTINNPTAGNRIDMTVTNNTATHNGACLIAAPTGGATGTGLYKPFMRVNVNKTWYQGWNTGARPILASNDAESNSNWTINIRLSEIPSIPSGLFPGCNSGPYREVRMDINQANPLELALNQIRVYTQVGVLGQGPPSDGNLVWSLDNFSGGTLNSDASDDHTVVAKKLVSGSGRDDLILLIPESAFPAPALAACPYDQGTGNTCNWYFTFFNEGGSAVAGGAITPQHPHDPAVVQSSGFEEWGVLLRPIPPRIQLKKTIVNDNGGSAVIGDFGIVTSAGSPVWDCQTVGSTTTCLTQVFSVVAGTVTFSETDVTGYTEGSWSCTRTAPSAAGPTAAGAYNSGSRAVADGEEWLCEITNNDDPGTIKLIKHIVNDNGGSAVVGAFGITLNNNPAVFGNGTTVGSTTTYETQAVQVNAGVHTFAELNVAGYSEGTWSCTPVAATTSAYNNGSVAVGNGQNVVCEITNNDDPGTLILIKHVDNAYGGTATAADFGITRNGNPVVLNLTGTVGTVSSYSSGPIQVNAGTQNFAEIDFAGYTEGSWSCTRSVPSAQGPVAAGAYNAGSQSVANGETWTCEITNTQDAPPMDTQTAWAANEMDCCTLRFNPTGGNWATYVAYSAKTVGFYAGQTHLAGTVTFSAVSGGMVTITINLSGGWSFAPGTSVAVQGYSSAPSGNPSPGLFANKEPASGTTHVIVVPAANFYAVHAVVQ
jgi:hypothetical protein